MVAVPGAGFPDTVFPVGAVERNIQQLTPPAAMPRILTSDQWADYLIYRLYPRQRVFFDGRSDFFGPVIGSDYRQLLAAGSSWREVLDRYQFDLALLPRDWPLSASLDREPGWRLAYRDAVAVLYARDDRLAGGPRGCPTRGVSVARNGGSLSVSASMGTVAPGGLP
jgi:hypothetical protein